jgi:uncharacterized integral membrane protein
MQLTEELILVIGAIIALVTGITITMVVLDWDLRKLKKVKKKTKKSEGAVQELLDLYTEPHESEIWVESLHFGCLVGLIILVIFLCIAFAYH